MTGFAASYRIEREFSVRGNGGERKVLGSRIGPAPSQLRATLVKAWECRRCQRNTVAGRFVCSPAHHTTSIKPVRFMQSLRSETRSRTAGRMDRH